MKLNLLTIGNAKTQKSLAKGYLNVILHLAPYDLSGVNVCPMAEKAGCVKSCLNTAGRGGISKGGLITYSSIKNRKRTNSVQKCRIRRTRFFLTRRNEFMVTLYWDILKLRNYAQKHGLELAVRLNGTSDIRWEDIQFQLPGMTQFDNIFAAFPFVQFYDYTKIPNRVRALDIPNYHLTFSYSGSPVFRPYIDRAIKNYGNRVNVAVVFSRNLTIPETFLDRPVINGDENDLRFLDPPGVIVALKAKGKARKDTSGFVVNSTGERLTA